MKKVFIVLILINITTLLFAEPDFRKVNWGMTIEEVKTIESTDPVEDEKSPINNNVNYVGYFVSLIEFEEVASFYRFVENELVDALYKFIEEYSKKLY